ncbi:hypothetical protein QBC45DRAFT_52031 [Copromyces sp. CBS 386.78]|nr:hypothetical protein QBC45DRAFT_52031 [Copromyces sp. CBS 386.78]
MDTKVRLWRPVENGEAEPRMAWFEDDNIDFCSGIQSSWPQEKPDQLSGFVSGSGAPVCALAKPPIRHFKWVVESRHFPPGFQASKSLQEQSPWSMCVRYLMDDFPSEWTRCAGYASKLEHNTSIAGLPNLLEDDDAGVFSWRNHQITSRIEDPRLYFSSAPESPNRRWGRRIVFSERLKEGRWLMGKWLVVAYLWCDDAHREWLRNLDVDVGDLVAPDTTMVITVLDWRWRPNFPESMPELHYSTFYRLSRTKWAVAPGPDVNKEQPENAKARAEGKKQHDRSDPPRMTPTAYKAKNFSSAIGSVTPVENGTPIEPSLETFCRLFDDKWPSLLYGESWMPSRRSAAIQRKWKIMTSTWHMQGEHKSMEGMNTNLRRRCV